MNKMPDIDMKAILPTSISRDRKVQEIADAVSKSIRGDNAHISPIAIYAGIEKASNSILQLLAWQFHADNYDASLTATEKRKVVKEAIGYHRYKGTIYAIDNAIRPLLPQGKVKEWFDYGGKPYHFKIITRGRLENAEHVKHLKRDVEDAKNVRSWLECIEYQCCLKQIIHVGMRKKLKRTVHVYAADGVVETIENNLYIAIATIEEETLEMGG